MVSESDKEEEKKGLVSPSVRGTWGKGQKSTAWKPNDENDVSTGGEKKTFWL